MGFLYCGMASRETTHKIKLTGKEREKSVPIFTFNADVIMEIIKELYRLGISD